MTTVEVHPLRRGDLAAAVAIITAGSLTPDAEDATRLDDYWAAAEATRRARGDVLVALVDGEPVGVCQVMILTHFQHAGGLCAELESVHVRADWRSRGVGGSLLAAAESLARDRGCYRMQLTSNRARPDAHRFYLDHGYQQSHLGFKKPLR